MGGLSGSDGWIGGEWNAVLVLNLRQCVFCECVFFYILAISVVTALHGPTVYSLSNTCLWDWRLAVTCQVLFQKVSQKCFSLVMCCHCTLEAGHLPTVQLIRKKCVSVCVY